MSEQPTAPATLVVGQPCPNGHECAQRSELVDGQVKMVAFCPACEGSGLLAQPEPAQN